MIARFGDYEVDPDKVEIRHRGEPVPVQPQVFSVIDYLIRERERAVSKEELLDNIWGDRFVSESALTSRIKSARQALGDSGAEQRVIRTIVGRGYRFVAELRPQGPAASPSGDPPSAPVEPSTTLLEAAEQSGGNREWPMLGRRRELVLIGEWAPDPSVPGVLVTGPEHSGVRRFVEACRTVGERLGHPTARIVGVESAGDIPLAALSPLLSHDVLASEHANEALAQAEIVSRARRELEAMAAQRRLIVVIENAPLLDTLSSAVISSLMLGGAIFAMVVRQPLASDLAESPLRELQLPRLDETTIDILLHRVLEGPIAPATLRAIVDMSNGRPGLVRDVVETSIDAGALVRDHGVWRLVAPLSSTARRSWDPTSLSDEANRGAQVLALIGDLTEPHAVDVIGDPGLEELDRHHMVALEPDPNPSNGAGGGSYRISLVDPILAAAVREELSPLRERRLKSELADRLLQPGGDARTIATIVGWQGVEATSTTDRILLTAAQTAMIGGDMETAGVLVEHVADHHNPAVNLIEAEVALRRSQWERAERRFEAIDVAGLDEMSAAHVLRRQAAIRFYSRSEFDETIDWLLAEADRRGGRTARALHARRVGMLAYLGRVDDTLAAASSLGDMHGLTAIEVLLSTASAHLHRGAFATTLAIIDEVDALIDELPAAWADEPRDGAITLRCSALFHIGRIDDAAELVRRNLPLGKRTRLGYFPCLAAIIELVAGRPKAARELIRPSVQSSHRDAFPQYLSIAESVFAATDLARGDRSAVVAAIEQARHAEALLSGELHWLLVMQRARLAAGIGEPEAPGSLLELAEQAGEVGAFMRQADLMVTAAIVDPSPAIAQRVVDRVGDLVSDFDGSYWPIQAGHVRAIADGTDLDQVVDAYRRLGYGGAITPGVGRSTR